MLPTTVESIANIISGTFDVTHGNPVITGVAIDHRNVRPGDLFVAFKGTHHDGHRFVADALATGAAAAMVTEPVAAIEDAPILRIQDAMAALQRLAQHEREDFVGPVIAITGSNGKTTTKDMIAAVFSAAGPVLATAGNYNNELGLPLTLLGRSPSHRSMVLEMGMRGLGQIQALCQIAKPTAGLITNVGTSHFELLGSQENIALAKTELLAALPDTGIAVLCGEDDWLRRLSHRCRGDVLWYGLDKAEHAYAFNLRVDGTGTHFVAHVLGDEVPVFIPLYGDHNVLNAIGALLMGKSHGISLEAMATRLASLSVSSARLHVKMGHRSVRVIDDCYNASPLSMKASLKVLKQIANGGTSVAILGDMFELGSYADAGHREVGEYAAELGIDRVMAIGQSAVHIAQAAQDGRLRNVEWFADKTTAMSRLADFVPDGSTVLVKASRGMYFETIVKFLGA